MTQNRPRWLSAAHAVFSVLAGIGFAITAFALFVLVTSKFDLYSFAVTLTEELPIKFIFYGYGLPCSLVIESLMYLTRRQGIDLRWRTMGRLVLYIAAGYAFFLVQDNSVFAVIAGTVGAVSALMVCVGVQLSKGSARFRYGFAFAVPLILFLLLQIDFTVKRGWEEEVTASSFEAVFDYFHGKHEIPIYADRGQTITFRIQIHRSGDGGHGLHVLDRANDHVPMQELGSGTLAIHPEVSGVYRIVVTGDELQGSVQVTWEVE